jgi:hypothetical protein
MKSELSITNESFNFLHNTSDFLNIVLNNIGSCILLLDKNVQLVAFNDALKTVFSNKKDENLLYMRCGEAIGCSYQAEEGKNCGDTSKCKTCELRIAALMSYTHNEVIFKDQIIKPFLTYNNKIVEKHLQFSTRVFYFNQEKYIIMIVDDITKWVVEENRKKVIY